MQSELQEWSRIITILTLKPYSYMKRGSRRLLHQNFESYILRHVLIKSLAIRYTILAYMTNPGVLVLTCIGNAVVRELRLLSTSKGPGLLLGAAPRCPVAAGTATASFFDIGALAVFVIAALNVI